VLELMDAMRDHFETQDLRAAEVTAGIERVGGTLEQLAGSQRTQSEGITSIATRVDDAVRRSTGLATMLAEMPASFQAQAEAVHAVARQMEAARAADAELTISLQRFSQAADSLRDAGTAQVDSLQRLHETSRGQKESLQAFVRQQTRLLLIITVIVAVLGLGAVAALAAVVRMLFNGSVPNVA
jgi:methyl-accepting chemotaxis protein